MMSMMNRQIFKGLFASSGIFTKFFVAFFCVLFCMFTFNALGYVAMRVCEGVMGEKCYQLLAATGTFVLSPLLTTYLISNDFRVYLSLRRTAPAFYVLAVLVVFVAVPLVNQITVWNEQMRLPECLAGLESWMKMMEQANGDLTKRFLVAPHLGVFLLNLLVLALIPAIGEELLFRGFLQKSIEKVSRNKHVAVWCAAFLFSAIHCQFYGFIPRMLMGALFGYFLCWSGSIWVPVACHFFNNSLIVCCYYVMQGDAEVVEEIGTNSYSMLIISLLLLVLLLARMRKLSQDCSKGNLAEENR